MLILCFNLLFDMKNDIFKQIFRPVLIVAILTVLSTIISLYFASRIGEISLAAAEKRKTLFLYQTSQEQFSVLREDFQFIEPHWDKISRVFPSSENIISFINTVENLAQEKGVQQTFRFEGEKGQPVPELNLNKIPFNINVGGTSAQFLEYLKGIEKLPYFVKIESINMVSATTVDGLMQANIRGVLYTK